MTPLLALLSLWLIPAATVLLARARYPKRLFLLTGVSFGTVVSAASMGLYGLYFLGPFAALIGMFLGLPLVMLHSWPGYSIAIELGIIAPRTVVHGTQTIYLWALDGLVWALIYGAIGWAIDAVRRSRAARGAPVTSAV